MDLVLLGLAGFVLLALAILVTAAVRAFDKVTTAFREDDEDSRDARKWRAHVEREKKKCSAGRSSSQPRPH